MSEGCAALAARCESFLDGTEPGQQITVESQEMIKPLGRASGLGSRGELVMPEG